MISINLAGLELASILLAKKWCGVLGVSLTSPRIPGIRLIQMSINLFDLESVWITVSGPYLSRDSSLELL